MDIPKLLAAYLISQGAHTGGHFYQAQNGDDPQRDTPIKLDTKNLAEQWDVPDRWSAPPKKGDPYADLRISHEDYIADNNRKTTDIRGAGFEMQDRIRDLIDDPETRSSVSGFNALLKSAYLAGVPMKLSKQMSSGGDIEGMEKTSGNKATKALLAASILNDIYQAKKPNKNGWSVWFSTMGQGAPGLTFNKRF